MNRAKLLTLWMGCVIGWGMSPLARGEITAADREAHPGMQAWEIDCDKPAEVKDVRLRLRYGFWDPKVDGDVSSGRDLQVVLLRGGPARLAIKVFVGAGKSAIRVNDRAERTGILGFSLDPSYALAGKPKANYDGIYVLAQKPADPKNPAPLGEVGEASAWIALGIEFPP